MPDKNEAQSPRDDLRDADNDETVQLDDRLQNRNAILYVCKFCLIYLCAPILYVGFVQAGLSKQLGASDFLANLPSSAYFLFAAFPIIMAWAIPKVRHLKFAMTAGFGIAGLMGGITAIVLWLPFSNAVRIGFVIAHGAVVACSVGTAWAFEWEILGRGISKAKRGKLFAWTFGLGPLFAVFGSLLTQLVVNREVFGWTPAFWPMLSYPESYVVLYGATLPLLLIAAALVSNYTVPLPAVEVEREPFISGLFGGFREFISYRLILIACIAYLLIYCGTAVQNNMVLYTREAVGLAEDTLLGYQLSLRFGSKILAGLVLGWVLTRFNPRMNLFITSLLTLAGACWILMAPLMGGGLIFLVAFAFNGAGELMGHYFPYYVLCLSPKAHMRRNMAFLMLLSAPVALAPALYGYVSDRWSLTASFWVSVVIIIGAIALIAIKLPANPQPRSTQTHLP